MTRPHVALALAALIAASVGLACCAWAYQWEAEQFEQTGRHRTFFR